RIKHMVSDSGCKAVLSETGIVKIPGLQTEVVNIHEIRHENYDNPDCPASPDNLAYVIYTSGSTGIPKGIMIEHRSVVNLICGDWQALYGRFGEGMHQALTASFVFDVSVAQIFISLIFGNTLYVITDETLHNPELFINFLQKKNIHIIDVSPGFLLSVVESKAAGKFPENIRHINLGAEKLAPSLIEKFYEYDEYQNITLCNFYGPTENCADSLWFPIDSGFQPFHTVPIGKPLPNIQVFILDAFLNPVPVGIPGEICLSGAGLARGYLNRPDLTAEKFVNWNPGTGNLQSEIRMYRTGDLGRWLADGNIEFLGRNDDQVKIRGYRVELGEIENHLLSHKSVSGTSVIAKEFRKDYTELAAYMTGDENLNVGELRNHLRTTLPDYMIPSYFIQLDKLPLTTGGKVDRRRLPEPETSRPQLETAYVTPETDTEQSIAGVWQELLKLEKVGIHDNFFDMGGHSLLIIRVQNKLQQIFSRDIPAVDLFRYPTISALARYLEQEQPAFHQVYDRSETREAVKTSRERRRASNSPEYFKESGIAVIGMSGRFPGADNIDEFWQNIKNGKESVSFFSDEELIDSGVEPSLLNSPNYVKAKGVLSDIDLFDALFFGFNPREAEIMGVQHRIFLECAWKALEDAGCNPDNYNGLIGVYAGAGMNTYLINNLCQNIGKLTPSEIYQAVISNDKDSLPTLASYKLNLKGPSIGIQTACSTSLVAVHMACQSLLNSECDMALAGGISVDVPHKTGYLYEQGMILSPDGHCRAFDANACGTVSGNGCGIVVLKRFEDALADRDCIYAVIRGSAVNNDGSMKVGFTAPSVDGQAGVIAEAIAVAGIDPDTITYIEAHGTGTIMGDPIEIAALTQVFHTEKADKKKYCAIGSVKTNIGHLDTAAGVTGLIKTVLALKNKVIPPSLNFEKPNSKIDFANSPFHVNTNLSEWKTHGTPRRAGVSSFGIGGTNAHVVLEEFGNLKLETGNWKLEDQHLLVLSAKTGSALDAATDNLAEHLKQNPDLNLADAAYTLQVGRKAFNHRRIVVCRDIAEAEKNLRTLDPKRVFSKFNEQEKQHVVFMFPGQGSQYVNMGLGLYQNEPVFRRQIDLCSEILKPFLKTDLRCLLYPAGDETEDAAQKLKQTAVAQAAVFTVEYALAVLWMEWGIRPGAMIGHSIGEYAAACLANVFSMEDALWLVAERGQMMQQIPGGSMLAVSLPEKEISIILENSGKEVSLSAVNGPSLCVVSGRKEAVEILQVQLEKQDIQCRLLHTSHAFHSEMMEPVTEAFAEKISQVTLKPPQIPFISDVTGTWITQEQSTDPDYWIRHLRQTVRFADGLGRLLEEPDRILLEVGPGRTLSTFATGRPDRKPGQTVLTSMRHPKDSHSDAEFILTTLGRLWLAGVRPDWAGFYAHEKRQRVHLPTYPFERKRYWIEPGDRPQQVLEIAEESQKIVNARISKKPDIADWFYVPSWKCSPLPPFSNSQFQSSYTWLLFIDECGLGDQLSERLEQAGQNVITVRSGSEFGRLSDKAFMLNRKEGDDYESLISELMSNPGKIPEKIVHLWSVTRNNPETSFDSESDSGFYSLLFLAQAISGQNSAVPFHITVVSDNIHQVTGEESLCPGKATALGPVKVIPQEYSNIRFKHIDVVIPESEAEKEKKVTIPLLTEMIAETTDTTIAFRGNSRWVQIFEPVRLEAENKTETIPLRERGVYLITGGLGGIGLILAEYLAKTVKARLVLTGRSSLPPREEWDQWTAVHGEQNDISRKLFKIRDIEDLGAKALPLSADAADEEQMRKVIVQAENIFGPINGVIHAAGNTRENAFLLIKETGKTICEGHFQPKAHGLLILEKILREKKPDFCLLMSSLSSVLGGLGFAAYSAANIFMDTFVTSANSDTDKFRRWISVNWDGWNFGKEQELIGSIKHLAVTPQEGTEAFRRILSVCPGRQVIVSSGDLQARFDQWIRLGDSPDTDPVKTEISYERHTRPGLETPYTPPENDTERIIADRWQTILGIDKIGIHDNFFELGGNSLVAVQLISWINETFWTELTLDTIFNTTTVAELAGSIESIHDSLEDDSEKIARKLEFVEGLSEDEVKIFLQDLKE
ncbi:MAG: SDR family NAD(P)-dependent oxidoreductase, partial [Desulfobacteraceae bacterium]|nr:SDR family NAD(P)-dependent oxidoreductase [Desulfobacteraceae bacterium]